MSDEPVLDRTVNIDQALELWHAFVQGKTLLNVEFLYGEGCVIVRLFFADAACSRAEVIFQDGRVTSVRCDTTSTE